MSRNLPSWLAPSDMGCWLLLLFARLGQERKKKKEEEEKKKKEEKKKQLSLRKKKKEEQAQPLYA